MRHFKLNLLAGLTIIFVGCSDGNDDPPLGPPKPNFSAQISFGDSLSDVGTYRVGTVADLGGGQYTINSSNGTPTNWTELTAPKFGLPAPCAAMTGLDGDPLQGFSVPATPHPGCTGYAQGGARVTDLVGPGNKSLGGANATLGQLTVPVVTQIVNHLATTSGGTFSGTEVVFVMAGANDAFIQAELVKAGSKSSVDAISAMVSAANELAGLVKTQLIDKGAKYVVVINAPDISSTPQVTSIVDNAIRGDTKDLFDSLILAYNVVLITKLNIDLPNSPNLLVIDAFTLSKDQVANPTTYGFTNVTHTACDLTVPGPNPLGSSLVCNVSNLITGEDTSTYMFADTVHPTPYNHSLFAGYVLQQMASKGWYNNL